MKLVWQEGPNRIKLEPSPTEKRIIKCLTALNIEHYREVQFSECVSIKGFLLYFDFYIPSKNLLIEYDGKHHAKENFKINDEIKNRFAKENQIQLVRFDKEDWKILERKVGKLVSDNYKEDKKIIKKITKRSRPNIGKKYRDKYLAQKNCNKIF